MRCLIDTNILISAALFKSSIPAKAFIKATAGHYTAVICDYSLDEALRVCNRKFIHKFPAIQEFLYSALLAADLIKAPIDDEPVANEALIRDANDRPIFRAAVKAGVDLIITGDKDFLEANIKNPKIITPAEFLNSF